MAILLPEQSAGHMQPIIRINPDQMSVAARWIFDKGIPLGTTGWPNCSSLSAEGQTSA